MDDVNQHSTGAGKGGAGSSSIEPSPTAAPTIEPTTSMVNIPYDHKSPAAQVNQSAQEIHANEKLRKKIIDTINKEEIWRAESHFVALSQALEEKGIARVNFAVLKAFLRDYFEGGENSDLEEKFNQKKVKVSLVELSSLEHMEWTDVVYSEDDVNRLTPIGDKSAPPVDRRFTRMIGWKKGPNGTLFKIENIKSKTISLWLKKVIGSMKANLTKRELCESIVDEAIYQEQGDPTFPDTLAGLALYAEYKSTPRLTSSLQTRGGKSWWDNYKLLVEYVVDNGHTEVPGADEDLGKWVGNQRNRQGMTPEREKLLNKINFQWKVGQGGFGSSIVRNEQFTLFVKKLEEFKAEYNTAAVPPSFPDRWLAIQAEFWRSQWKKDKKFKGIPVENDEKYKILQELGFDLEKVNKRDQERNAKMMKLMKEYSFRHGHCHVPTSWVTTDPDVKKLRIWVENVRENYNTGVEFINKEETRELNAIDFDFCPVSHCLDETRIETKVLHLINEHYGGKHFFTSTDNPITDDLKSRPDGFKVFFNSGKCYAIIFEIDEHRHDAYTRAKEQIRMNKLVMTLKEQDVNNIYFLRVNVAERYLPDERQQTRIYELLDEFIDNPVDGVSAKYLDFPKDHHHYLASMNRVENAFSSPMAKGNEEDWIETWLFDQVEEADSSGVYAGEYESKFARKG